MRSRSFVVALSVATVLSGSREAVPNAGVDAARATLASPHVIPAWYATARTAPASPVQLSRVLAMVHAAMHDAVNAVEPRYETYASDLTAPRADAEAAAAAAAHRVLVGLFPAQQTRWDSALAESLSAIPDGRREEAGVTF